MEVSGPAHRSLPGSQEVACRARNTAVTPAFGEQG